MQAKIPELLPIRCDLDFSSCQPNMIMNHVNPIDNTEFNQKCDGDFPTLLQRKQSTTELLMRMTSVYLTQHFHSGNSK